MADLVQYYGTGRRKAAIARVYLRPGSGEFKVNERAFEQYFVTESQRVRASRWSLPKAPAASMCSPTCREAALMARQTQCAWALLAPSLSSMLNCARS